MIQRRGAESVTAALNGHDPEPSGLHKMCARVVGRASLNILDIGEALPSPVLRAIPLRVGDRSLARVLAKYRNEHI